MQFISEAFHCKNELTDDLLRLILNRPPVQTGNSRADPAERCDGSRYIGDVSEAILLSYYQPIGFDSVFFKVNIQDGCWVFFE
jgi:hypothetical protein